MKQFHICHNDYEFISRFALGPLDGSQNLEQAQKKCNPARCNCVECTPVWCKAVFEPHQSVGITGIANLLTDFSEERCLAVDG